MRLISTILFLLSTFSVFGEEVTCKDLLFDVNPARTSAEFWKSKKEFRLGSGRKSAPFKFGFDAELWQISDNIALISRSPKSFLKLEKALREDGPKYTLKELQTLLGLESENAVRQALRNPFDAGSPKHKYVLTDVSLEALQKWDNNKIIGSQYAQILWKHVDHSLKKRNIPVSATLENDSGAEHSYAVELVMDGATSIPSEFKEIIDWLFAETQNPQAHFHVSVPVAHIEAAKLIFVARAIEMKIVIDELVNGSTYGDETYYPHDRSSFTRNLQEVRENDSPQIGRGIVRVEADRWEDPDAHDVEIRSWYSKDHALGSVYALMELVKNESSLRDTSEFRAQPVRNIDPPNLNGALRYAAYLLEGRIPRSKARIPGELVQLAIEIEAAGQVDKELYLKIAAYLKTNTVSGLLTPVHFFTPSRKIRSKLKPNSSFLDVNSLRMGEWAYYEFSKKGFDYFASNFTGDMDEWGFTDEPIEDDTLHFQISDRADQHTVVNFTLKTKDARAYPSYGVGPTQRVASLEITKLSHHKSDKPRMAVALEPAIRFAFQELLVSRLVMSTTTANDQETAVLEDFGFTLIHTAGTRKFYELRPNANDLEYQRTHTHLDWE